MIVQALVMYDCKQCNNNMEKNALCCTIFFSYAPKNFLCLLLKLCANKKNAIMKKCLYKRGVLFIITGRTKQASKCFSLQYELFYEYRWLPIFKARQNTTTSGIHEKCICILFFVLFFKYFWQVSICVAR